MPWCVNRALFRTAAKPARMGSLQRRVHKVTERMGCIRNSLLTHLRQDVCQRCWRDALLVVAERSAVAPFECTSAVPCNQLTLRLHILDRAVRMSAVLYRQLTSRCTSSWGCATSYIAIGMGLRLLSCCVSVLRFNAIRRALARSTVNSQCIFG